MKVALDIGGTNLRAGLFSDDQRLVAKHVESTPENYRDGLQRICSLTNEFHTKGNIEGVAVAIAGVLDRQKGKMLVNPNLMGWNNVSIGPDIAKKTGVRVVLENDAVAAGLGEANFGAGKGKRIVAFLTISTGIGGARIVDGKTDENTWGFEPGHQVISVEEITAVDGRVHGWFERYASGSAFEARYGVSPKLCTDGSTWKDFAKYLSAGIVNIMVLWSPDIVVLGGGVSRSAEKFFPALREYLDQAVIFPQKPPVVAGTLGDEAGLYGGLVLLS